MRIFANLRIYINTHPLYICIYLGISSYHDNHKEDRRWSFECCRIYAKPGSQAQGNDELADGNTHETVKSKSHNRTVLIVASISAALFVLCIIFAVFVYVHKKKKKLLFKYVAKSQDEDIGETIEMKQTNIDLVNEDEETQITQSTN